MVVSNNLPFRWSAKKIIYHINRIQSYCLFTHIKPIQLSDIS